MSLSLYLKNEGQGSKKRFFLSVFLLIYSISLSAFVDDFVVKIEGLSSSGNTIFVDRGRDRNIDEKDYGILLAKEYIEAQKKFVYKPVARLRVVKLFQNKSVWLKVKSFGPNLIKKNKKFLLFSQKSLLSGRSRLSFKRSKIVTNKKTGKETLDSLAERNSELAQKDNLYRELEKGHDKEKHYEKDIELVDVDKWKDELGDGSLQQKGIYKSPHAKEFKERKRVQTFEKMVVALLNKYNDPAFDADQFRKLQGKSNHNVYGTYKTRRDFDLNSQGAKKEKFYRDLISRGDAWSDDYSDEELSSLLTSVGEVRERERRKTLLGYNFDYQVYGSFGLNLISNDNLNDKENTANAKYDFEIATEGYFFKRMRALNKYSMELSFRRALDSFYGGKLNAKSTEHSMAFHFNWYPGNGPNTMDANIFYIGMHLRYGLSRLVVESTGEEGNYQVFSFPGLRAGLKHNFFNGYGFRATLGLESIGIDRVVRSADEGTLPDRASYLEGKVGLGLSKLF